MPINPIRKIFGLLKLVRVLVFPWRRIKDTKIHDSKKSKNTLAMAPPDPRCNIGTKIETKDVLVTSLE